MFWERHFLNKCMPSSRKLLSVSLTEISLALLYLLPFGTVQLSLPAAQIYIMAL